MGISDKKVTGGWTDGTSINEVAVRRGCTVFMISWVGGACCPVLETLTLIHTTSYDFPHAITTDLSPVPQSPISLIVD